MRRHVIVFVVAAVGVIQCQPTTTHQIDDHNDDDGKQVCSDDSTCSSLLNELSTLTTKLEALENAYTSLSANSMH